MSKPSLSFEVIGAKHCSHDGENIKHASAFPTLGEAVEDLITCSGYPIRYITTEKFKFEWAGTVGDVGTDVVYVEAGTRDDDDQRVRKYQLILDQDELTDEWLAFMFKRVTWLDVYNSGNTFEVEARV